MKISSCILFILAGMSVKAQQPIFKNSHYTIYPDRVEQGKFLARAISRTEISSNYQSPANEFQSADIVFKFSINGKDNEMRSGVDHQFTARMGNGITETPIIRFGQQLKKQNNSATFLAPNTKLKIRVDLNEILSAFKKDGYYTLYNGEKLYKEDFKAIHVAGGTAPMTWDFNNLHQRPELELKDPDGDGIYETELTLNVHDEKKARAGQWKLSKDISAFPDYRSEFLLTDAVYNMAIEEMIRAVEPDSTFRTGAEWAGVWTRDISYSIILSMAYLQPQVAKNSLMRKVSKKKKIIQDTGTGGAWPVSTDRMVWAIAAWEVYLATGDRDWLKQSYIIIKNSIEDDYHNAYDPATGLVKGESSFLDWREQTYPAWMQPADIFESQNLGTNAVHYQVNRVLAKMAVILQKNNDAARFNKVADGLKTAINKWLWISEKGYYGQYLYGRNYSFLSPRAEALGEALSVLFDIAGSRQSQVVASVPQTGFGIPCIYPQIPGIPPYHNNAVWPFVQSFWLWAGAKVGNEASVLESMAAIYRPAALFLTNKENFVADNGDFMGTQINSSNMLWSLAGNISMVHKVLFGFRFTEQGITFQPFVPKAFSGKRTLSNFRYRDAILDIELEGSGNVVKEFFVDGKLQGGKLIPANMKGRHQVKIVLAGLPIPITRINRLANQFSLPSPELVLDKETLRWQAVKGVVQYSVLRNGKNWKKTKASFIKTDIPGEYTVIAMDKAGVGSFASEPVMRAASKFLELENFVPRATHAYKGFSGKGFIETSTTTHTSISIPLHIDHEGWYGLDIRYANGNGPVNTENKCAIRTAVVDGKSAGVFVFPQRGSGEWSNWGFSNSLQVFLTKGAHTLRLEYLPANENMNELVNQAMLDQLRMVRLEK
jgi:hypothetical protein